MCTRLIVCQTQLFGGGVDIKKRKSDWLVKRTRALGGGDDGISGGNQAYISHASQAAHSLCSKRALCNQKVSPAPPEMKIAQDHGLFHFPSLPSAAHRYRSRQLCCLPPYIHIYIHTCTCECVTFCAVCEYPVAAKKRKDRQAFILGRAKIFAPFAPDSCQLLLECERARFAEDAIA